MFIQCANNPALYGFERAGGRILVVGEKRALSGASIGGWMSADDDRLRRESMLIRAVGGGVERSIGVERSGRSSGKSALIYSGAFSVS
jgi:hypothetical protein